MLPLHSPIKQWHWGHLFAPGTGDLSCGGKVGLSSGNGRRVGRCLEVSGERDIGAECGGQNKMQPTKFLPTLLQAIPGTLGNSKIELFCGKVGGKLVENEAEEEATHRGACSLLL